MLSEKTRASLIREFIESELADYQEPEHRGTPRGDPVGFSLKKMRAAYELALSGKTEREVAGELDVSESGVRKWTLEASFNAVQRRITSEFRRYFAQRMRREAQSLESAPDPGVALPQGELVSPAVEYDIFREVSDALEREQERAEWFQAALRHTAPLLAEKLRRPRKKWIFNRAPHDEAMMLWRLEKMINAKDPLEETVRILRAKLYHEAEEMLKREDLGSVERARIRSLLEDLRKSEEMLETAEAA